MSNDVAESINQLIAGHFNHVGLCQLHTKQFCMQLTKAYVVLTIYSTILNNVAMSLYNISVVMLYHRCSDVLT